jgi:hypothetical protein
MKALRPGLFALVALIAVALAGCLESRLPLFDESKAVTPAPAGRYEVQERKLGAWVKRDAGTLKIENHSYSWKIDDQQGSDFFTLQDVGGGFYIAAARKKNPSPTDPYTYALFEATKDGYLAYTPTCGDMMKVRLPKEDMPVVDGSDCFYTDREMLVRSLKLYAQYLLPTSRYVLIKP